MLDLDLFEHDKIKRENIYSVISKIKNIFKNTKNVRESMSKNNNHLDEFELYEKKKLFLDNKSRKGNPLAWVMDENSVCISEEGDGGPILITDIKLPSDASVGQVYEKTMKGYVYNQELTVELSGIA